MKNFIELVKRGFEIMTAVAELNEYNTKHALAKKQDPIVAAFTDAELVDRLQKTTQRFNELNEELTAPNADPKSVSFALKTVIFNMRAVHIGSVLTCMGQFEAVQDMSKAMERFNETMLQKLPEKKIKSITPFAEMFKLLSLTAEIREVAHQSFSSGSLSASVSDKLEDLAFMLENHKHKQIKLEAHVEENLKSQTPVRTKFSADATGAEVAYALFCTQKPHLRERAKDILKSVSKGSQEEAKKVYVQELNATYSSEFKNKQHPEWPGFLQSVLIDPYVETKNTNAPSM